MIWLVVSAILSAGLYTALLLLGDWGTALPTFLRVYAFLLVLYGAALAGAARMAGGFPRGGTGRTPGSATLPASLDRRSALVVLGGALLFRLLLLPAPPGLSDDVYRYLWDGRVLLAGVNPYRFSPLAPELASLRDALWTHINHPELPTIYPPLLMVAFALVAFVSPTILAWKAFLVLVDLGAGLALMGALAARGIPRVWAVLYLWHPLVVVEFAENGHADAVGVLLVSLAFLYWAKDRNLRAGIALALGGLVKFLPWVAVPALLPRLRWRWLLLPLLVAACYLPFALGGIDALGSLRVFASKWRGNDFLFTFLLAGRPPDQAALFAAKRVAAILVAAVWLAAVFTRRPLPSFYAWTVGAILLLSPVVHPWYVIWLLPALLFVPHPAWWVWSLLVIVAYFPLPEFRVSGLWVESWGVKAVEYLPVLLLIPVQIALERGRRSGASGSFS